MTMFLDNLLGYYSTFKRGSRLASRIPLGFRFAILFYDNLVQQYCNDDIF
jgi:hypothetical protein